VAWEARAQAVAADLEELCHLRHYLISKGGWRSPHGYLTRAIDDYVEKLTGDRTKLHAPHHSIGPNDGDLARERWGRGEPRPFEV
jgi:hypothetical protein